VKHRETSKPRDVDPNLNFPLRTWLARGLILCFCAYHVTSVLWWLIPMEAFSKNERMVRPAEWFASIEDTTIAWKKRMAQEKPAWIFWLENYTYQIGRASCRERVSIDV
jgi:hypothetical protein